MRKDSTRRDCRAPTLIYQKYTDQYAAISVKNRSNVLAHAMTGEKLREQIENLNIDPSEYVVEKIPPSGVSFCPTFRAVG